MSKARYAQRKALGVCTACGKQPPVPARTRCALCAREGMSHEAYLAKARARSKAWKAANREAHLAQRRAKYATHLEARHKAAKASRDRHRERIAASNRTYRDKNLGAIRAQQREYHQQNKEKRGASNRQYRVEHREEIRVKRQAYRLKNIARIKMAARTWRMANAALLKESGAKRRAQKKNVAIHDLTVRQWEKIKAHYNNRCVYCGRKMKHLTQDHLTPISQQGNHTLSNVVPACRACNSRKKDRNVLAPVQPLLLLEVV
jgi:5-methylcytosine-specific restriction endonuclease McrA